MLNPFFIAVKGFSGGPIYVALSGFFQGFSLKPGIIYDGKTVINKELLSARKVYRDQNLSLIEKSSIIRIKV